MNNKIEESHCSFEVSKLLKEKGFNVETYSFYNEAGVVELNTKESYGETEYLFDATDFYEQWNDKNSTVQFKSGKYGKATARPTHAVAVEWLRVNFGRYIQPLHRGDFGDYTYKVSILKLPLLRLKDESHHISYDGFNTPHEATEAALIYTLKN